MYQKDVYISETIFIDMTNVTITFSIPTILANDIFGLTFEKGGSFSLNPNLRCDNDLNTDLLIRCIDRLRLQSIDDASLGKVIDNS